MNTRRTKRSAAPVHPLWKRWIAAVCLLLAGVVGTAQAVHSHGKFLSRTNVELHQPSLDAPTLGDEHCPLCVALHITVGLPEAQGATFALGASYAAPLPEQTVDRADTLWHYARFSRPPPARG